MRLSVFSALLFPLLLQAQLPAVSSGKLERIENFPSKYVTPRHVDVWLPEGYTPEKRYAVLYMHDGQMLFDAASTWNKQAWEVDEVAAAGIKTGNMREFIVVGIWNGGETRHVDYFPQKPFESLPRHLRDSLYRANRTDGSSVFHGHTVQSDRYLKFLVKELKPLIDSRYGTLRDRENTFVAGSSMGGLISWYALCEYPGVFGGAACLSTHWPGTFSLENNPVPEAFFAYLRAHLPDPRTHRLWFDYGDATLDALYPPLQARADEILQAKGYAPGHFFPGEGHSEKAWNKRLAQPLAFLLGNMR